MDPLPRAPFLPLAFDALGVPISLVDKPRFLTAVEAWLASRGEADPGGYVCFRDVHGVVRAWDDPTLAEAHRGALMVCPDGAPLAWLARRRGHRHVAKVCGPEMMPELCEFGQAKGWRHAFFGSTPEILQAMVEQLRRRAPGLQVTAAISPPFGRVAPQETAAMVARLAEGRPHLVWIGLGSPKQELWMAENAWRIPGALCLGVGAAFDIHAGRTSRPPLWMRRTGMEWAGRILKEPRRLGARYGATVPRFLWRAALAELELTAAHAAAALRRGVGLPPQGAVRHLK